ncbi:hypothetical protein F4777DRAFT_556690 [Nemania sp. FL0916]|nr:hypothetical protein F4777DRAFT_556690 [Nemania sp. FL0916]
MSSMLKKTGGLSFKPKAGRRPGAKPSNPAAASSTSASTTRAPTTEPPSQASTPAASDIPTPTVPNTSEAAAEAQTNPPIPVKPLPTPADLPTPSASEPRVEISAVQPTSSEPAAESIESPPPPPPSLSVVQNPTPQLSDEVVRDEIARPGAHAPAVDVSRTEAQPTPQVRKETPTPHNAHESPQPSAVVPATAPEPSVPEETISAPPTVSLAPPPTSDTIPPESQPEAPKKTPSRRRKSTVTDSVADTDDSAPKKKRQRRTKSSSQAAAEISEVATPESEKPKRRRKREPTPENAEELTVDHSTMTVGELTKDLGIGKRFRHAEEVEQRAREARAKNRLRRLERDKRRLGLLPPEEEDNDQQPDATNGNGESRGAAMAQLGASMEAGAAQSVGYDVVDGQIVVHAASLVVDRHNQDMSQLEEVEENEFTNLITSASFAKRVQAPGNWTDEDTEKFYRLLGMFGTDFETISRLFPGKNRRSIKLKFNKEERLRPNRINAAMMVRGQKKVNIDIEEYKASQRQWEAKEAILEENARLAEEQQREVERLREERRAAGLIDDDAHTAATKTTAAKSGQGDGEMEVIEENADALGQGGQDNATSIEETVEA